MPVKIAFAAIDADCSTSEPQIITIRLELQNQYLDMISFLNLAIYLW